jgi:lipopolysaccharide transport protein LptA
VLSLAAILAANAPPSQSPSEAKPAERMYYGAASGRRLLTSDGYVFFGVGEAYFRQGKLHVTADRARYYESDRYIWVVGNVHAITDSLQLWADSLRVGETQGAGWAYGHVRLLTNDGSKGTGERGIYWRDRDAMALVGSARLVDSTTTVDGDSLFYDRAAQRLKAFGAVKLVDEEAHTVVTGERGVFERGTGYAYVDSLPTLRSRHQEGATAAVKSKWMSFDTQNEHSRAIGEVHFQQGQTIADADTADFYGEDLLILRGSPRVKQENQVMTGSTIRFGYLSGELRHIAILGKASLVDSSPDTLKSQFKGIPLTNELHGDSLYIDLKEGEVLRTSVSGHAQSVYLPEDQTDVISVNEAEGDSIEIAFANGRVERVTITGSSQGKYHFLDRSRVLRIRAEGDSLAAMRHARLDSLAQAEGVTLDSLKLKEESTGPELQDGLVDFSRLADTVGYSGESTVFWVPKGRIKIQGTALVSHQDLTLTAKSIDFDTNERELIAEGEPMIIDTSSKLVGDRMGYLFDYKTGAVDHGITRYDDGFYYGRHVRRVNDETLLVRGGMFTSCDLEHPHYHFSARKMKVKIGKSVVARQVTFYISDLPVFAFPFFFKKIDSGRHSGIMFPNVNLGVSGREGRYIRDLGYYWATNEYTDFTFKGAFNERRDLSLQIRNRYNLRYKYSGDVEFTWTTTLKQNQKGKEWKFLANHRQPELFDAWNLTSNLNLTSNTITNVDPITGNSADLLPTELRSNLSLSRGFESGARLNLSGTRTQYVNAEDDDPTTDHLIYRQTLPSVSLSFKSRPLLGPARRRGEGSAPAQLLRDMTFSQSYRGDVQRERHEIGRVDELNASGNWGLSYNPQYRLGPFNLTSSGSFAEAYSRRTTFSQSYVARTDTLKDGSGNPILDGDGTVQTQEVYELDSETDKLEEGTTPSLSWRNSLSTNLYGIFDTHLGALRGVKHKFSLAVSHSWRPQLGDKQSASQSIGIRVGNELSFKYAVHPSADRSGVSGTNKAVAGSPESELVSDEGTGQKEEMRKLERLLTWDLSTSYRPDDPAGQNWDNIGSTVRLSPGFTRAVDFTMNQSIDPYRFQVLSTTVSTNLRLDGKMDFGGLFLERKEPKNAVVERIGEPADTLATSREDESWFGQTGGQELKRSSKDNTMPWNFNARASITNGRNSPTRATISTRMSAILPISWNLDYSANFDVETGNFTNQSYSLSRDIHQWRIEFRRSVTNSSDFSFRIYLRSIPDLKIQRGNQSLGGYFGQVGSF